MAVFEGIPLPEKMWLVRKLLGERTKQSLFGRLFLNVQKMDDAIVMKAPEGTIVTIVEMYYVVRKAGASADEAFAIIENRRSMMRPSKMPPCATLDNYVTYRVRLEHREDRQMTDFEIFRATSMTSEFIEKFFGAGPIQENTSETDAQTVNIYFMSELPHPDVNRPDGEFKSGDVKLRYYENPRTIGSLEAGTEPLYRCPQVVVVSDEKRPLLIIRSEQNAQGGFFLCSLDATGRHTNWGEIALLSRNDFVRKAGELLLRIKYGEDGRVDLKTL
jgi:hypothetical protein